MVRTNKYHIKGTDLEKKKIPYSVLDCITTSFLMENRRRKIIKARLKPNNHLSLSFLIFAKTYRGKNLLLFK